jgi:hypothetical protein
LNEFPKVAANGTENSAEETHPALATFENLFMLLLHGNGNLFHNSTGGFL